MAGAGLPQETGKGPGTKAGMAQGVSGYLGDLGGFFVCCRGSHGFGWSCSHQGRVAGTPGADEEVTHHILYQHL